WKLLFFDVATSFDSDVHRVHAVSFIDAADWMLLLRFLLLVLLLLVTLTMLVFVFAVTQSSCFEKIYLETWN
ncbi:hypothetical protein Tco_0416705, partial [Tanacetum coccineum]